jgi:hypothetical protein
MEAMLIEVKVGPEVFSSETVVSLQVGGENYELIVDKRDLQGDKLKVHVVARSGGEALIDLPRETLTSGSRICVPTSMLHPAVR